MAKFVINAVIQKIGETQVIGEKFSKRSVLFNESTDPKSEKYLIEAEVANDALNQFNSLGLQVGDNITAECSVNTRLYTKKTDGTQGQFTSVKIQSITK